VVGLPDQEFEKMLRRPVEVWGEYLTPGDRRHASNRNVSVGRCSTATLRSCGACVTPARADLRSRQSKSLTWPVPVTTRNWRQKIVGEGISNTSRWSCIRRSPSSSGRTLLTTSRSSRP
jgi:hypothetical protein